MKQQPEQDQFPGHLWLFGFAMFCLAAAQVAYLYHSNG